MRFCDSGFQSLVCEQVTPAVGDVAAPLCLLFAALKAAVAPPFKSTVSTETVDHADVGNPALETTWYLDRDVHSRFHHSNIVRDLVQWEDRGLMGLCEETRRHLLLTCDDV